MNGRSSFPDFTKQHIFEPLGMKNTAWFLRDLPRETVVAVPVQTANRRGTRFKDVGQYCFIDFASGSLRTTAADLADFLNAMSDRGIPKLWSAASGLDALTCLEQNRHGKPKRKGEYGANWILLNNDMKSDADDWLAPFSHLDWTGGGHHDGAEAGCQTQILVLPEAGVYVAVLTNTDGNDEDAAQMVARDLMDEVSCGCTCRRPFARLLRSGISLASRWSI